MSALSLRVLSEAADVSRRYSVEHDLTPQERRICRRAAYSVFDFSDIERLLLPADSDDAVRAWFRGNSHAAITAALRSAKALSKRNRRDPFGGDLAGQAYAELRIAYVWFRALQFRLRAAPNVVVLRAGAAA